MDPRPRDRLLQLVRLGDRDAARRLVDDALRRDDLESCRLALDVLGHRRSASALFKLRALAAREPSPGGWRALVAQLRSWPESEGLLYAIDYVAPRLEPWPARVRAATWGWWFDLTRRGGRHAQLWQLVRRLELDGSRLHVAELERVAHCPELGWLRSLALEAGRCGDGGAEALADSPYLAGLRELELGFEALGARGAAVLARAENLPRLERLVLANNPLGDAGLEALAGAAHVRTQLRELALAHCAAGDRGVAALAASGLALERLDLACNRVGDEGLVALFAPSSTLRLVRLDVSNNPLGERGVAALAASEAASRLEELDLGHCALGAASVAALAGSGALRRLRVLQLRGAALGDGALRRLWRGLPSLDLLVVGDGRRLERAGAARGLNAMADALGR